MKVIHLGTVVQSQFGVVDDDGNVVQTFTVAPKQNGEPDVLAIQKLAPEAFSSAYEAIVATKAELQKKADEAVKAAEGTEVKLAEETVGE